MEKVSERDLRALKRQQIALEQERKDLLERVERQQSLTDSLQKKSGVRHKQGNRLFYHRALYNK